MILRPASLTLFLLLGAACGPEKADSDGATSTGEAQSAGTTGGPVTSGTTSGEATSGTTSGEATSGTTGEDTLIGPTTGPHPCGSLLANNDENCNCLPGYERCDPNDPANTDCCVIEGGGGTCPDPNSSKVGDECFCNIGYEWCSPDPDDLSCCEVGETTDGTTTGEPGCPGAMAPPPVCDEVSQSFFCTHPEACGPQGSEYFVCEGGEYQEQSADELCELDGFDFAYGCVDTPDGVFIECGSGSGAPCVPDSGGCSDDMKTLESCKWGKTTEVDCFVQCTEVGDMMGVLYDFGSCGEQDGALACVCCDKGDPGCPI